MAATSFLPLQSVLPARTGSTSPSSQPAVLSLRAGLPHGVTRVRGNGSKQGRSVAAASIRRSCRQRKSVRSSKPGRGQLQVTRGAPDDSDEAPEADKDVGLSTSVGVGVLWLALSTYAFGFSPNDFPDQELLAGLLNLEDVEVNSIFYSIFLLMGLWPVIYASVLIPAGRSTRVPAWPFLTASFAFGCFALLPYFALWEPAPDAMNREQSFGEKLLENRTFALVNLFASIGLVAGIATSSSGEWSQYLQLFNNSRLVHMTSIDFVTLSLCAPIWLLNDAEKRRWKYADILPLILGLIPCIGPCLYILLRPRKVA